MLILCQIKKKFMTCIPSQSARLFPLSEYLIMKALQFNAFLIQASQLKAQSAEATL